MIPRLSAALAAGISLCLAGCGERHTVKGADGERVEVAHGAAAALAPGVDLPSYMPMYPGGRIESTMGGVSSGATGSQKGGLVSFKTDDAPEKVAAFYRPKLDQSGLSERSETNLNGVLMLTAASADDSDRGVQVSIAPVEGGSQVTLIYSNGGA